MSRPLKYVEVLMVGKDSPCHGEAYVVVSDGVATEKTLRHETHQMFLDRMYGFSKEHAADYKVLVDNVKTKGVLKWVAGAQGNVIFDMMHPKLIAGVR